MQRLLETARLVPDISEFASKSQRGTVGGSAQRDMRNDDPKMEAGSLLNKGMDVG